MEKNKYSYVTFLGTDDYLIGTLCLYSSLKSVKAKYPLLVLCSDKISSSVFDVLAHFGMTCLKLTETVKVGGVTNKGKYERWNYTFDKLQAFNLTEFEKVVFLDSDMMLVRNVDHLFKAPHMSAVVADVFDQPGCNQLNSGLMVIQPSASEFLGMMKMVSNGRFSEMFACGDQDIIRAYFKDWHANTELRLPIGYNLYYPFVHCFDKSRDGEIYNIHFVYDKKPWQLTLTQVLRRLRRHNWCYLLRYLRMVHKFRALLRKKGINL